MIQIIKKYLRKKKIQELPIQVNELDREILILAGHKWSKKPFFSVVGSWDCPKSPCGLCCYEHYLDPVHDYCVFCGEPEERK